MSKTFDWFCQMCLFGYVESKYKIDYYVLMPPIKADFLLKVGDDYLKPVHICENNNVFMSDYIAKNNGYKGMICSFEIGEDFLKNNISLYVKVDKELFLLKITRHGRYSPFSESVKLYTKLNNKLFYVRDNSEICFTNINILTDSFLYLRRNFSFFKYGIAGIKSIIVRIVYNYRKKRVKKGIWLFSDRIDRADDNGEALFEYASKNNDFYDKDLYFVITKDSKEVDRLAKYGKIIEPFSKEHKMLYLLGEYIFSSQANVAVVNPFRGNDFLYRDLTYDKKIIFLQHGVTKDNLSKWLNKYNRNLFGLVVTTKQEYDSFFNYNYYYENKTVWLTGMPRYDRLYHDENKYIAIMPTWRKALSSGVDASGKWIINDLFYNSQYFKQYNDLINSDILNKSLRNKGYKLLFVPHPNITTAIDRFDKNDNVIFMDGEFSYRDVFARANLLITDYSSVAFDFAYLRKPVLYFQFDKDSFFAGGHSYTSGYFNYERDGFGEVEYTIDSVIDRIIEYVESDCSLKKKYEDRINATFPFNDHDCCKRVLDCLK